MTDLLRQVPPRSARWQSAAAGAVLLMLAVAAVAQLRGSSGPLAGLELLAPCLVMLAVAVLAARLVSPVAAALGARALRRAWLGTGLGGLRLARRPGTAGLLTVLTVALAELLFATISGDVAAQARSQRVSITLGAPEVLSVAPVPMAELLRAVRTADPQGRYAMATSTIPAASQSDPPLLAVDSSRLARVATWWPGFGALSAGQVAARLHPPGPAPVLIHSQEIDVDLSLTASGPTTGLHLYANVITLDDTFSQVADLGEPRTGRHSYEALVTRCSDGCRLPVVRAGAARMLPGLGTSGALVDMEYADRVESSTTDAADAAVWLSADAPADIGHRLAAAGLTVISSRTVAGDVAYLGRQGPGVGGRFQLLAGLLALVLAVGGLVLVAAVDRRRTAPGAGASGDLWMLRSQGVPARTINRANLVTYLALVAAAIGLAPLAAGVAWWATGLRVPVFADGRPFIPPPAWPGASAVLRPWLLGGALFLAVAAAVTYQRRSRRRRRS